MHKKVVARMLSAVALCFLPHAAIAAPSDPPSAGEALTFDAALRRALERSPDTAVAAQEIQRSRALAQQVRAGWLPTLMGNGTYTHFDEQRALAGVAGQDFLSANVVLTVPLVAARAWAADSHARDLVDVAKYTFGSVRKQVAVATARAFLGVIAQRRVLESAIRARDTAKAHDDFSKARLAGGLGNRLDAVRAAQELATNESNVQTQYAGLARAQEALGVLVGAIGPADAVGEAALTAAPDLPTALADIPAKRAEVRAQQVRVEAARVVARDTWTEYMPMLSAVGQPFYQTPGAFSQPGWQAQLVLSLPLYDGGLRYGLGDERRALHAEQQALLEGALRQAKADVRIAFESVRRADLALAAARSASKLAAEALALAELAYRAGATSNLEVVDAERRARDADTGVAIAEDAARQARLDLLAACGRFP